MIEDLIECCQNILEYTAGMDYEGFVGSKITKDAVVRNFEIIGEASNILSEDFKSNNPQVEWRKMTGLRNRLIHEYFGVDYDTIWKIITTEVQQHLEFLETIDSDK